MATNATIEILPQLKGPRGAGIIERFRALVDAGGRDRCWPWKASCKQGYGRFKISSYEIVIASRFALVLATREEHLHLHALHSCDNPTCCNPNHLRWGTAAENMADMRERNRARSGAQDGLNNGACKLGQGDLETIIRRLKDGYTNIGAASGLPVSHALVSRIRTGRSWVKEAAALGWVPKVLPDPRRGKTRLEYAALSKSPRPPSAHDEGVVHHG